VKGGRGALGLAIDDGRTFVLIVSKTHYMVVRKKSHGDVNDLMR